MSAGMSAEFPEVAHIAPESVQRGLDNPLPRKRRTRKAAEPKPELRIVRAHDEVWKQATLIADAAGIPRNRLQIAEDGKTVLIANHNRRS